MKIKAEVIDKLPPGTKITINGERLVRMADSISHHLEGFLFNPKNGDWKHWSCLIQWDEEIDLDDEAAELFCDFYCNWGSDYVNYPGYPGHNKDCQIGQQNG